MRAMTHDAWLAAHPYLRPVAELHARINAAADHLVVPRARPPRWDAYRDDFHAGIPLLKSARAEVDIELAEELVMSLMAMLELRGETIVGPPEALARYLRWTVLVRYLSPVVQAFGEWRDEERWLRSYCPTCGERPAMAQLVGVDPGRVRLLSCGCCRTRWRYRRTACPFCDSPHDQRVSVLIVDGEGGLRIDYCERCRGYLKTYSGEGSEHVLLADWTSLHLDVIARDRGLKPLAASLYSLETWA